MDWLTSFPHLDDDLLRALKKAIDDGFRSFTRAYGDAIEARFGRPPRVTLAVSSDGAAHFYPGYDYVASAKSVLEALVAVVTL